MIFGLDSEVLKNGKIGSDHQISSRKFCINLNVAHLVLKFSLVGLQTF
jgi:hypothetical protein